MLRRAWRIAQLESHSALFRSVIHDENFAVGLHVTKMQYSRYRICNENAVFASMIAVPRQTPRPHVPQKKQACPMPQRAPLAVKVLRIVHIRIQKVLRIVLVQPTSSLQARMQYVAISQITFIGIMPNARFSRMRPRRSRPLGV